MNSVIETDERIETYWSFVTLADFLEKVEHDLSYWRWVYIAMHNALQGSMVVALRRSDGLGILSPK